MNDVDDNDDVRCLSRLKYLSGTLDFNISHSFIYKMLYCKLISAEKTFSRSEIVFNNDI